MTHVTLRGTQHQTGVYVLHLHCAQAQAIVFGRFAGGRPVPIPAGDLLYVGSAMGRHATSLAGRLLRHATRCPPAPPHDLRDEVRLALLEVGLDAAGPDRKRQHWHIDYLMDAPGVTLQHVWAERTATPLEWQLAGWLATLPELQPVAPGLGASDHRGHTHLWRLDPSGDWESLARRLATWRSVD